MPDLFIGYVDDEYMQNQNDMINRGYLLFCGEYQIYFIECVENISNFTSA